MTKHSFEAHTLCKRKSLVKIGDLMQARRGLTVGAVVTALALFGGVIGTAAPASAATPAVGETISTTTPMQFAGYDAEVAAANGFKIVMAPDGTQSSVPVTAQARSVAAAEPSAVTPQAAGNCGVSTISGSKGANDRLSLKTGYVVPFEVRTRHWVVTATSFFSSKTFNWNLDKQSSGTWSTSASAPLVGPGVAGVSTASFVIGVNGRVCHSVGPTFAFG
jgi:hypothetical protein